MLEIDRNKIGKRQNCVFLIFIVLFLILGFKIFGIQHFEYNKLSVMANSQYAYAENTTDVNFLLFDCDGNQLLNYNKKYYAVICPDVFIRDNENIKSEEILTLIYILRNYNKDYDISKIGVLKSSQKMYFEVDESTYEKLKKLKGIKGFYAYEYMPVDRNGVWKIENLLINPRRTVDDSTKSKNSIEMQLSEKTKNNKTSQVVFQKDVNNNIISETKKTGKNNVNLRLTLNKNMEDNIKSILNNYKYKKFSQIGAVLMEANTGDIRAIVQKDDTNPNVNLGVSTNHGFFPGSIFKVIVEEAGLDENKIFLSDKFTSTGLYEKEDEHEKELDHGTYTPAEAFVASSNDVFSQIASKVGYESLYKNSSEQGLLEKVLNFDEEKNGAFETTDPKISDGSLGLTSIGQNIRITPVEAISIPNTVVNSGVYVKPHIIDAYVDNDNNVIEKAEYSSKQILKESTANEMKSQMIDVVKKGTGIAAYMDDVEIGGKTGTTQRMELSSKSKSIEEHSDGWFAGFFNLNGKNYSMIVFVQDIDKDNESGGNTAAPIFKDIVSNLKQDSTKN
ncbi:MAG: penicillin-binding protein 2 [Clostridium sp.]|jgi:cell division protein FtsI/penicillin-binding protein 2|uniref:penicillin-binding transpeptidase domain-containing protein n=1 Tax=Clostridium sp. TaxID=1506 RepID=UPI0025C1EA6D|nr:penicillin-binding transpeptidase domain-containing protein [Clostridium sp.]MCH3964082.1 penicillin-binding protein 2 [Clostridium sp.]MCI1716283.1 penicillin-binding protein 2 [Clostridium sp.]MCI1800477.1 penicillin-binding protein 2 [Clostridium sp.]MCI1814460.1 penicillin-binding protein 2 [Clostridium sp.]MCI1871359.1 penicillin-binding protein 2 [Clostridium sp.]